MPWCQAAAGGFVPGHPLGSPQGFVLGSAWPARSWERWGNPCQPSSPELRDPGHSAPCSASRPAVLWCHPRMGCWGAGHGGRGEQDLSTDIYWQFANVKKGPEGAGDTQLTGAACTQGGGQPRWRVPRCLAPPEPCWAPFPGPGASWALSKRGCLLMLGLATLFVPLTFSSLYAVPFYGGFKVGWDPPPCPWKPRFASYTSPLALTSWGCPLSTSGWPAGTTAVPHVPGLPPFPPCCLAPPAALSTLGKWVRTASPLQRDSRHFAPCKERWETWHQGLSSCAALQSPPASCPLPEPCPSQLEPPGPSGVPEPHALLHSPSIHSMQHHWIWAGGNMVGQQQGLPPTSQSAPLAWAANASVALPSRIPACPQAGAPTAHQLLAWLERSILGQRDYCGHLGCPGNHWGPGDLQFPAALCFPLMSCLPNYKDKQGVQGITALQAGSLKGLAPREVQGPKHSRGTLGTGVRPAVGTGPALAEGLRVPAAAFAACHVRKDRAWLCVGSPAVFDPGTQGSSCCKLSSQPRLWSRSTQRTPCPGTATCKVGYRGLSGVWGRQSGAEVFTLPVVTRPGAAGNRQPQGQGWEQARAGV